MATQFSHHIGVSDETWRAYNGSTSWMREVLVRNEPEPEPRPGPQLWRPLGTLIVAGLRTQCPVCPHRIQVGEEAVMMDWEDGSKAFHVGCAEGRGWVRP